MTRYKTKIINQGGFWCCLFFGVLLLLEGILSLIMTYPWTILLIPFGIYAYLRYKKRAQPLPYIQSPPRSRYIPQHIKDQVFWRDQNRCRKCGALGTQVPLHLDHIIPFSQGGPNIPENLQLLCANCNLLKGTKPNYCPKCFLELHYVPSQKFCPNCGSLLQW